MRQPPKPQKEAPMWLVYSLLALLVVVGVAVIVVTSARGADNRAVQLSGQRLGQTIRIQVRVQGLFHGQVHLTERVIYPDGRSSLRWPDIQTTSLRHITLTNKVADGAIWNSNVKLGYTQIFHFTISAPRPSEKVRFMVKVNGQAVSNTWPVSANT